MGAKQGRNRGKRGIEQGKGERKKEGDKKEGGEIGGRKRRGGMGFDTQIRV